MGLAGEAGQVVGHGDRGDVEGQLDGAADPADLIGGHGGVGAGEVDGALDELGAPGPGAAAGVVDGGAQVGAHEGVHPGVLRVGLGGGARAADLPHQVAGGVGVGGAGVAPAGGQRGQGGHAQGAQGAATGQEHGLSSLSQRGSGVQSDTG